MALKSAKKTRELHLLLPGFSRTIRELNRQIISPTIHSLTVNDLTPVMEMVARARAAYIVELFNMTKAVAKALPDQAQVQHLKQLRETYEELLHCSGELEIAIEKGYIDVQDPSV